MATILFFGDLTLIFIKKMMKAMIKNKIKKNKSQLYQKVHHLKPH
jgi:hypothetical protein